MMFNSGKRAQLGLGLANHDPFPYRSPIGGWRESYKVHGGFWYDPRPEFDVLDNPILSSFRGRLRYQEMAKRPVSAPALAAIWTTNLYRYTWDRQHGTEAFTHAERVLTKLAALA